MILRKINLIVIIIVWGVELSALGLLLPWSAKSAASGCCGFISGDSGVIFSYPSLGREGISISSTQAYNIAELPRYIMTFGMKWGKANLGYAIDHLHHPHYKETAQLINIGYSWGDIRAGTNIHHYLVDISNEPIEGAFTFDLGISWRKSTISSTASWLNVASAKLNGEEIPVYYIWETNWQVVETGSLSFRIEKETGFEFHPTLSGNYTVSEILNLISSYSFYPESLGCGFEITIGIISVSYGLQYHEDLQESHFLSIQYAPFD